MNQFFKNGFRLETESLNALNEAYKTAERRRPPILIGG